MDIQIQVMPRMNRPPHRWDTCCRDWIRHDLRMRWTGLRMGSPVFFWHFWGDTWKGLIGKCPWHGSDTRATPVPPEGWEA
jgi:hypothetical protein